MSNISMQSIFGSRYLQEPIPKYSLPKKEMSKEAAYQLVHDELLFDGNPRLNLASFVTTWMEPEGDKLILEALNKNYIDFDEYPASVEIQDRCVNIIARLFHAPLKDQEQAIGTSTIGSSEAIMLAGLAMKRKWQERRRQQGKPYDKPNMVAGANVQVCWEKFARYFEVELKEVKLKDRQFVMDPIEAIKLVDENTILVCAILGSTYNGEFEDIKTLNDLLIKNNEINGWNTPIHVDAASGGFVAPFIYPSLEWDFRLPLVKSINVSGHKYGLTYAGIGWAIWRSKEDLPNDLVFHINYLGSDQPSFTLNFTKGASNIIAQYYQFIRLGFQGYESIIRSCEQNALYLAERLKQTGNFMILSKKIGVPVVTFSLIKKNGMSTLLNEHEVANRLRQFGWIIPAYTMAPDLEHVHVLRVVIREDFRRDQAEKLVTDINKVVAMITTSSSNETFRNPSIAEIDNYDNEEKELPKHKSSRNFLMEQLEKLKTCLPFLKENLDSAMLENHSSHRNQYKVYYRKTRSIC